MHACVFCLRVLIIYLTPSLSLPIYLTLSCLSPSAPPPAPPLCLCAYLLCLDLCTSYLSIYLYLLIHFLTQTHMCCYCRIGQVHQEAANMEPNVDISIPHPQASVSHSCMRFYAGIAADLKEGSVIDRGRERRRQCVCVFVCVRAALFQAFQVFAPVCAHERELGFARVAQNTSHKFYQSICVLLVACLYTPLILRLDALPSVCMRACIIYIICIYVHVCMCVCVYIHT